MNVIERAVMFTEQGRRFTVEEVIGELERIPADGLVPGDIVARLLCSCGSGFRPSNVQVSREGRVITARIGDGFASGDAVG